MLLQATYQVCEVHGRILEASSKDASVIYYRTLTCAHQRVGSADAINLCFVFVVDRAPT